MLNIKKLQDLFKDGVITKTKLCEKTKMSRSSLDAILKGADTKVSTIEAIADALDRPVGYFFDEEAAQTRSAGRDYLEHGDIHHQTQNREQGALEAELRERIDQLQSQLRDKDRIIELLEGRK